MKHIARKTVSFCLLMVINAPSLSARSIHRPPDPHEPSITAYWQNEPENKFILKSRYLEKAPFFEIFNKQFFDEHLLPEGEISYRYEPEKNVSNIVLNVMIEKLIKEIQGGHKVFTDFTILRNSDFNFRKKSGLIILKCKHHPFVVKLFMEKPSTFIRPFRKGFVPVFFFFMGGGVNRHLSGFTRVKNLYDFQKITSKHPVWANRITTPRKWFWTPKDCRWINVDGKYLSAAQELHTSIPCTYCVIADLISIDKRVSSKHLRKESLRLCNDVKFSIDPHSDNFFLEEGSGKIALIDTEHFPSMVGFKANRVYESRFVYYRDLVLKAVNDVFFHEKQETA